MRRVSPGPRGEPHLRLRAQLMDALREVIRQRDLRQREAAVLFGVAQPRISDLVRGKLALFSIDTLVSMLAAAGVAVEIRLQRSNESTADVRRPPPERVGTLAPRRRSSSPSSRPDRSA